MHKKHRLIFIAAFIMLMAANSISFAQVLIIADFDRGQKPNVIGGDFGSWNRTEWDRSQFCNEIFINNPKIVYKGKGCSLQLDYDVDSSNTPAYNGFWMRLEKINLNKYGEFAFYIKGDSAFGYTTKIIAEIKSMAGDIARFRIEDISDEWQKITLPLHKIKNAGDFSEGSEFTLVFEDRVVTKKVGRVYIDQIYVQ